MNFSARINFRGQGELERFGTRGLSKGVFKMLIAWQDGTVCLIMTESSSISWRVLNLPVSVGVPWGQWRIIHKPRGTIGSRSVWLRGDFQNELLLRRLDRTPCQGGGKFMLGSGWGWRRWMYELNWCLRESCSWLRNCRRLSEGVIRLPPLAFASGRYRQRALFASEGSREIARTICVSQWSWSTTWSCNNCASYNSSSQVWVAKRAIVFFLHTSIKLPKVSNTQ